MKRAAFTRRFDDVARELRSWFLRCFCRFCGDKLKLSCRRRHTPGAHQRHTYGMATIIPCASPREQWCLYTDSIGEVACANIVQIMSVVLYTLGIEYMCELRTCAALRA